MVGFLGCEDTLLAHVQLAIHQYPQIRFSRAVLNPFIPQFMSIMGVATTKVQDIALSFVRPHEVLLGPLLEPVWVFLDGIPSLRLVSHRAYGSKSIPALLSEDASQHSSVLSIP